MFCGGNKKQFVIWKHFSYYGLFQTHGEDKQRNRFSIAITTRYKQRNFNLSDGCFLDRTELGFFFLFLKKKNPQMSSFEVLGIFVTFVTYELKDLRGCDRKNYVVRPRRIAAATSLARFPTLPFLQVGLVHRISTIFGHTAPSTFVFFFLVVLIELLSRRFINFIYPRVVSILTTKRFIFKSQRHANIFFSTRYYPRSPLRMANIKPVGPVEPL